VIRNGHRVADFITSRVITTLDLRQADGVPSNDDFVAASAGTRAQTGYQRSNGRGARRRTIVGVQNLKLLFVRSDRSRDLNHTYRVTRVRHHVRARTGVQNRGPLNAVTCCDGVGTHTATKGAVELRDII